MFEKVNPSHPDKVADRIAGAIVDLAYKKEHNPKIAVEVLIGHGECNIIVESNLECFRKEVLEEIVKRISGQNVKVNVNWVAQDKHLANNQENEIKCGDNGIFKGVPTSEEEIELTKIAKEIYGFNHSDGKYIIKGNEKLIVCQSNCNSKILEYYLDYLASNNTYIDSIIVNPLGDWTGGTDVDTGATNRKLGSDVGRGVTGGGLHGKDLSKADVSVNIYAYLKAQETGKVVELCCAIGDNTIDGKPYSDIVEIARKFIKEKGGFEKFAEWGLI